MKKDMRTDKQKEYEKKMYHNTEILLKRYRDVVWSMEVSAIQARMNFEYEMGCSLDEFLQMSYAAGMDFSGTDIQEQLRTLERSKKMLNIIKNSVEMLRKRGKDGETYYWLIYYTFLSEKPEKSIEDIIQKISEKTDDYISWKTYYKYRKGAINVLSTILWGFTSKECLPILEEFV